jgi:hypothetical protein
MMARLAAGIGLGILLETLNKYRRNIGFVLRASHNRRPCRGYYAASHDRTSLAVVVRAVVGVCGTPDGSSISRRPKLGTATWRRSSRRNLPT